MTTNRTVLVADQPVTGDAIRRQRFPGAWVGGYQADAVDGFCGRIAVTVDQLHRALAERQTREQELGRECQRLSDELLRAQQGTVPMPRVTTGPQPAAPAGASAASVLRLAQGNADMLLSEAREEAAKVVSRAQGEADQLAEHARLQADGIIADATRAAEEERNRIVSAATALAQRQVEALLRLAGTIGDDISDLLAKLDTRMPEWRTLQGEITHGTPAPSA